MTVIGVAIQTPPHRLDSDRHILTATQTNIRQAGRQACRYADKWAGRYA